jgi:hypothetical protein
MKIRYQKVSQTLARLKMEKDGPNPAEFATQIQREYKIIAMGRKESYMPREPS